MLCRPTHLLAALALMLAAHLAAPLATQAQYVRPSETYEYTPEDGALEYKAETVTTQDGASIQVWYLPCINKSTSNTIIFCHGGQGNMGQYLDHAYRLASNGYNVVMFDYRGFGASSAFNYKPTQYIAIQWLDDLQAVMDWTKKNHSGTFHLVGIGPGATLAMGHGLHTQGVRKIVADHPCKTLESYKEEAEKASIEVMVPPFGYPKHKEPIHAVVSEQKSSFVVGVLLIVGGDDTFLDETDMEAIASKWKAVQVHVVEGVNNTKTFEKDKEAWVKRVLEFLNAA